MPELNSAILDSLGTLTRLGIIPDPTQAPAAPPAPHPAPPANPGVLFNFNNVPTANGSRPGFIRANGQWLATDQLMNAIGGAESNYGANTKNAKYPQITGAFQMGPAARLDVASKLGIPVEQVDSSNPEHARTYINMLANDPAVNGDVSKLGAAYNWGIGHVANMGSGFNTAALPPETQGYITKLNAALGTPSTSVNGAELDPRFYPGQVAPDYSAAVARAAPVGFTPTPVSAPSVPYAAPAPRGPQQQINPDDIKNIYSQFKPTGVDQDDLDTINTEGARRDVQIAHAIQQSGFGKGILGVIASLYSAPSDARVAAAQRQYKAEGDADTTKNARDTSEINALVNTDDKNNNTANAQTNLDYADASAIADRTLAAQQADRQAGMTATSANNSAGLGAATLKQSGQEDQARILAERAQGDANATNTTTQGQHQTDMQLQQMGLGVLTGDGVKSNSEQLAKLGDTYAIPMTSPQGNGPEKEATLGDQNVVRGIQKGDPALITNGIAQAAVNKGYLFDPSIMDPKSANVILNAGRPLLNSAKPQLGYDPKSKPNPQAQQAMLASLMAQQPAVARALITKMAHAGSRGAQAAASLFPTNGQ